MNFKEISSLLNSLFLGYSDRLTHLSVLFNPKLTNKFDIYNNVRIQFIITDITLVYPKMNNLYFFNKRKIRLQ
jgi:hypothetical protein